MDRSHLLALSASLLLVAPAASAQAPSPDAPLRGWPADRAAEQLDLERRLDAIPAPERLADWHERFSSEPHVAGSEGDRRLIEKMAEYMESMGLEVEVHPFTTYLSKPVSARLQIVAEPELTGMDDGVFAPPSAGLPLDLPIREPAVEGDTYLGHPDLTFGWNAYAGSGDVTAPVVYANYGTREDFLELRRLGISVHGKIVLARYGGNFRGFKAKFAEEEGAAGLVIFSDPGDAGYARGATYPEGGWANSGYIQRGSLLTLPYAGDPLTPFEEASADAERLDPEHLALPRIPVQPIGWGAAYQIVRRLTGPTVPAGWQGGLPVAYRLGGDGLKLRLRVEQKRELVETANVLGFLRGAEAPDQWVLVGSHHDAWSFGAGDPNAGTILVFEAARAFADAAAAGRVPARTLVFAHWGAEEFGIIGSTEWAEARRRELLDGAVAYLNLDGAAMGKRFSASASPSLKSLIADVTGRVPQAGDEERSVHAAWGGGLEALPFGNLGGGSDHVAFYCHLGVPSANLSAGGSPGVSYHSNYENLAWYRRVVGDDYSGAVMLTRLVDRLLARLANGPLLPLDPAAYGKDLAYHLAELEKTAAELDLTADFSKLAADAETYTERAQEVHALLLEAVGSGQLVDEALARANRMLLQLERQWLHEPGLPERPWFRNLFAATDPASGYGAWMLPALRFAVENARIEPSPLPRPAEVPAEEEASETGASKGETQNSEVENPETENPETENPETVQAGPTSTEPSLVEPTVTPQATEEAAASKRREAARLLEETEALYAEALERLSGSLDELQALLPGELLLDDEGTDAASGGGDAVGDDAVGGDAVGGDAVGGDGDPRK